MLKTGISPLFIGVSGDLGVCCEKITEKIFEKS